MATHVTREGKGNKGKSGKGKPTPPKKNKPLIKRKNFSFYYKFSDVEAKEKAKQLAEAVTEKTRIEDDKKQAMSGFKSKIDSKVAEINLLSGQVSSGQEYVTKTCDAIYDFDAGKKRYIFDGKEVGAEELTAADHQLSFDDVKTTDEKE